MRTSLLPISLLALCLCSCTDTVVVTDSVIDEPDTSTSSLAGEWIRYDTHLKRFDLPDRRIHISGPNKNGQYRIVMPEQPDHPEMSFVVAHLTDSAAYRLVELDMSPFALPENKPVYAHLYAIEKDGWLFLRSVDRERLTETLESEKIAFKNEDSPFFTTLSVAQDALLNVLLKGLGKITTEETSYYRRATPGSTTTPDNNAVDRGG